MKLPHRRRGGGIPFNLTPMIDVVFLLVIFFLVATYYIQAEPALAVQLPLAGEGHEAEAAPTLTLTVNANGDWFMGLEPIDRPELQRQLITLLETEDRDTVEFRIRADDAAPYEAVSPLLTLAVELGIRKVRIATRKPSP